MTEPDTVMDPHDTRPGIPDDDLHAWLDGRLSEDQHHTVDARLALDLAARDTVAAYRSQREALLRLILLHRYSHLKAQVQVPGWQATPDFGALAALIWP